MHAWIPSAFHSFIHLKNTKSNKIQQLQPQQINKTPEMGVCLSFTIKKGAFKKFYFFIFLFVKCLGIYSERNLKSEKKLKSLWLHKETLAYLRFYGYTEDLICINKPS